MTKNIQWIKQRVIVLNIQNFKLKKVANEYIITINMKGKKVLYIITNLSLHGLVKVGITSDLEERLKNLNNRTNLPTKFQIYEVFEKLKNPDLMEQAVLLHFKTNRINKKREFIMEHPERICDFVRDNKDNEELSNVKGSEESKGQWDKLGIPEGEKLFFINMYGEGVYKNIVSEVGKGKNIVYKGKKTSLSNSARSILNEKFDKEYKSAQGTIYWTYKGRTIADLMAEQPKEKK